jgi:cell division protein FtsB
MPQISSNAPKPIVALFGVGLLVYFSVNISSILLHSYQNHQRLQNLQQEVAKLRQTRDELKNKLHYEQSDLFVEQTARDQLSMARPNETVVIFPRQENVLGADTHAQNSQPNSSPVRLNGNLSAWADLFLK